MIKDSIPLTRLFFVISVILGGLVSFKIAYQPVSKTMLELRISLVIMMALVLLFGVLGILLCKKYNMNDELMLSEDDNEYYNYLEGNFKYYLSFSPVVALVMLLITFVIPFHFQEMSIVVCIFYFAISFFQLVPFLDILYTIVNAMRYHNA